MCIEQLEATITRLQREHEDQSATAVQSIDQLRRQLAEADEQSTRSSQAMELMQQELANANGQRATDWQEIARLRQLIGEADEQRRRDLHALDVRDEVADLSCARDGGESSHDLGEEQRQIGMIASGGQPNSAAWATVEV